MLRIAPIVLGAVAALALAGCAPAADAGAAPSVTPTTSAPTVVEPAPTETQAAPTVDPADAPERLQFSATTLAGDAFDGRDLYGQATIIWFWAPWCPICNAEAPLIADALDELPDGVQVIGIPGRSDNESMQAFVDKYGFGDVVQVVDVDGTLWSNFGVAYQPAVVTIDREGNIRTMQGESGKSGFLLAAQDIA